MVCDTVIPVIGSTLILTVRPILGNQAEGLDRIRPDFVGAAFAPAKMHNIAKRQANVIEVKFLFFIILPVLTNAIFC